MWCSKYPLLLAINMSYFFLLLHTSTHLKWCFKCPLLFFPIYHCGMSLLHLTILFFFTQHHFCMSLLHVLIISHWCLLAFTLKFIYQLCNIVLIVSTCHFCFFLAINVAAPLHISILLYLLYTHPHGGIEVSSVQLCLFLKLTVLCPLYMCQFSPYAFY